MCWDDSKDIYRGTEKGKFLREPTWIFSLRKSAYGFVILLAAQLCVWDTTPEKKDQDGDAVEEKMLELENTNGSRRRQVRRARQSKRRLKRQKDRFKSMRNLRINWYNVFAVCVLYVNLRIVVIVVKIVQRLLKDSRCITSSDHGANSVSMDYCLGFFFLMIFLRFYHKGEEFPIVAYTTRLHIPSPRFCGAFLPGANLTMCKNEMDRYLHIFGSVQRYFVHPCSYDGHQQPASNILWYPAWTVGQWPFINYLDTVIPEA